MRGMSKGISNRRNRTTRLCQTGAFAKSECVKEISVHLFKVDAKHSHRRAVHQRVWRFGIGGSRPNGFMLAQWPCVRARGPPVALSTGQITPRSAIRCCLSICMLFSCTVTWRFLSLLHHMSSVFQRASDVLIYPPFMYLFDVAQLFDFFFLSANQRTDWIYK